LQLAKWLAERGVDVNLASNWGQTALHFASQNASLEFVKWLVEEKKLDAGAKDSDGATPLHFTAQTGNLEVMRWYVKEKNADVNAKRSDGVTPLHEAVRSGGFELVYWLVKDAKADLTAITSQGATVLEWAFSHWNADCKTIKYIIEEINVDRSWQSTAGYGLLHLAAMTGSLDLVKWLVEERGVDIMAITARRSTPLHFAATAVEGTSGSLKLVKWLVEEKKLDVRAKDKCGYTPLHYAWIYGNRAVAKWLEDIGAENLFA